MRFYSAFFIKNVKNSFPLRIQNFTFKSPTTAVEFTPYALIIDRVCLFIISAFDSLRYDYFNTRWGVKVRQLNEFTYEFHNTSSNTTNASFFFQVAYSYLSGWKFFWRAFRYWLVGVLLAVVAAYYLLYVRLLPFNKLAMEILLIGMFVYWLMSGFVFFIKKYQYSKFTTVIQRFWKRSYALFWMLETFVFLIFFYCTMNASEEPVYMYDQMKLYKTHLFSWRWFLIKLVPCVALILLTYYVILSLRWGVFLKQNVWVFVITLVLIYVVWLEFYQFFHIINWYNNFVWVYDYDEFLWTLEIEGRRTRLANNYSALCLMAKFWHLIFIFVFWLFFILRINEIGRVRYILLGANFQNFIILYIMSWLYMYPWLKFLGRKYLDFSNYWYFVNFRELGVRIFFNDLYLFVIAVTECFTSFVYLWNFSSGTYFYWIESTELTGYSSFIKNTFVSVLR